jgi:hypothetical protein
MERASCVLLEDKAHKWLSVSAAVAGQKVIPVKADLKTVSKSKTSIQSSEYP